MMWSDRHCSGNEEIKADMIWTCNKKFKERQSYTLASDIMEGRV